MESCVFDDLYGFFRKVSPEIKGLSHCFKVKSVVVSRGQCFYSIESLTSVMNLIVTDRGCLSLHFRQRFLLSIKFVLALPPVFLSNDYDVRGYSHPLSFNPSGASESVEFVVNFTCISHGYSAEWWDAGELWIWKFVTCFKELSTFVWRNSDESQEQLLG